MEFNQPIVADKMAEYFWTIADQLSCEHSSSSRGPTDLLNQLTRIISEECKDKEKFKVPISLIFLSFRWKIEHFSISEFQKLNSVLRFLLRFLS